MYEQSRKLNACSASGAATCHRISAVSRATIPASTRSWSNSDVSCGSNRYARSCAECPQTKGEYKRLTLWVSCTRSRGYRKRRKWVKFGRGEISRYRVIVHGSVAPCTVDREACIRRDGILPRVYARVCTRYLILHHRIKCFASKGLGYVH